MNTDTQHLAYVLYPGETEKDIPKGFLEGLKKVNRLQDIVKNHMIIGDIGDDILKRSLKQMREEGIEGRIYCHPIGDWGHSAGTLIGLSPPITVLCCANGNRNDQSARWRPSSWRIATLGQHILQY